MLKNNKHIEIVRSTSKGLSSMSRVSCDAIYAVLAKYFTRVGVTIVNTADDLDGLIDSRPDLVFLGMEFVPSNPVLGPADPHKIWLSDVLDSSAIAYTGSAQGAHELGRNKQQAKQRMLDAGLTTSAYCVIVQNQSFGSGDINLDFPLFIKPINGGGGSGVDSESVVHTYEQLQSKVHSINTAINSDALIEEYLPGREFSVAILQDEHSTGYQVMPIELVAPPDKNGSRLLSSHVKTANIEQALEITDAIVKSEVSALALGAFRALGGRDYGRIDIRLDRAGTPYFLEANLIPSLISGYGSFPKACVLNIGLDYEPMILSIVRLGLSRTPAEREDALEPLTLSAPAFPSPIV